MEPTERTILAALRANARKIEAGDRAREERFGLLARGRDVGLSEGAIAEAAGIGRSTVRTLLTRARQRRTA